jgi:hypothetical protein
MLCACVAGAVIFVTVSLPTTASIGSINEADLKAVAEFFQRDWHWWSAGRPVHFGLVSIGFRIAQLDPARWLWAVFVIHALNAALLIALAVSLRLPVAWSVSAGLLFLSGPAMYDCFRPKNVCDHVVLTAFLLLITAYQRRREARGWTRGFWLLVEVFAVVLGAGSKESFLLYPALLLALEFTTTGGTGEERTWQRLRQAAIRLAPHAVLFVFVVWHAVWWAYGPPAESANAVFSFVMFPQRFASQVQGAIWPWRSETLWQVPIVGYLATTLFLLAAIHAWRRNPAVTFGVLMAIVVALPVSVLNRVGDGYFVLPWAGLVLATVSWGCHLRSWLGRAGLVLWLMTMFLRPNPVPSSYETQPPIPRTVLATLAEESRETCDHGNPVWRVPSAVRTEMVRDFEARGLPPSESSQRVQMDLDLMIRLQCRKPQARAELDP